MKYEGKERKIDIVSVYQLLMRENELLENLKELKKRESII